MARFILSLLLLLSLLSVCLSARLYHRHGSLEERGPATATEPWRVTAPASESDLHSIILVLHSQNLDYLRALHRDIHDPDHPQWLQHLSAQQIHDITAPPAEVTDAITAWLRSHGVAAEEMELPLASDSIHVTTAVRHLNAAFNTTLHRFAHVKGGHTVIRQLGASSVPDELAQHIDFVEGLAMLPLPLKRHGHVVEWGRRPRPLSAAATETEDSGRHERAVASAAPNASVGASPLCTFYPIFPVNSLYAHYSIPDQSSASLPANPTTSTSTIQFWTQDQNGNSVANSFSSGDVSSYSQLWSASGNTGAIQVGPVRGPNQPSDPQDEPSLDTQSLGSMNPTSAQSFELVSSIDVQQYGWASSFVGRANIPQVVSISYGLAEAIFLTDGSSTLDGISYANYLDSTNNLFMKSDTLTHTTP